MKAIPKTMSASSSKSKAVKVSTSKKKLGDKKYYNWLSDESVPLKERVDSTWSKQTDYLRRFLRLTISEKEDFYRLFSIRKEIKSAHKAYLKAQKQKSK